MARFFFPDCAMSWAWSAARSNPVTLPSSSVAHSLHSTGAKYQEACPGSKARHAGIVIRCITAGIAPPVTTRASPGSNSYLFVLSSLRCVGAVAAPAVPGVLAAPCVHLERGARVALHRCCAGMLHHAGGVRFGWKSDTTGAISVEIQPRSAANDAAGPSGHNGGGTQI